VVLDEPEHVEHQQPGAVFASSDSGSSNRPSSIAGSFDTVRLRPLRALGRRPQHVRLREERRALLVQVDDGVIGVGWFSAWMSVTSCQWFAAMRTSTPGTWIAPVDEPPAPAKRSVMVSHDLLSDVDLRPEVLDGWFHALEAPNGMSG
jgi:hypothetical protein